MPAPPVPHASGSGAAGRRARDSVAVPCPPIRTSSSTAPAHSTRADHRLPSPALGLTGDLDGCVSAIAIPAIAPAGRAPAMPPWPEPAGTARGLLGAPAGRLGTGSGSPSSALRPHLPGGCLAPAHGQVDAPGQPDLEGRRAPRPGSARSRAAPRRHPGGRGGPRPGERRLELSLAHLVPGANRPAAASPRADAQWTASTGCQGEHAGAAVHPTSSRARRRRAPPGARATTPAARAGHGGQGQVLVDTTIPSRPMCTCTSVRLRTSGTTAPAGSPGGGCAPRPAAPAAPGGIRGSSCGRAPHATPRPLTAPAQSAPAPIPARRLAPLLGGPRHHLEQPRGDRQLGHERGGARHRTGGVGGGCSSSPARCGCRTDGAR